MALNPALTVHLKSRPRPCSAEEAIRFEREFASKSSGASASLA